MGLRIFGLPITLFFPSFVRALWRWMWWRLSCVQVGARCVGTVLKRCLKARTQNTRRNDPGVYFILQLVGRESVIMADISKCQYLWIKDQVRPRDLGKASCPVEWLTADAKTGEWSIRLLPRSISHAPQMDVWVSAGFCAELSWLCFPFLWIYEVIFWSQVGF